MSDYLTGTSTPGDWRNVSGGGATIHGGAFTAAGIAADHELTVIDIVQASSN